MNLVNGLANGANDFVGWALQPFDEYAGELITFESSFPGGRIAAGPTVLLGRMSASLRTANAAGREVEAFHYTFGKYLRSIQTNGLRQGTYATRSGTLSPLQAQIELALPANRGLPDALVRIDLAGLRQAGYQIPGLTRVTSRFGLPGGGYEMLFPYPIPPQFITVIR